MDEPQNENKKQEETGGAADGLQEKLAAAEKQRDEYLAGWQRTKADFINYKKEEMKHLEEIARYGSEDLIKDLISVLDNFDLGIKALEKNGPVEKGIYLIRAQIEDLLRKRGLQRIELKVGDSLDPSIAEAIAEVPKDIPAGMIVEEIEPGYRLHEKILRPARVIVSKGKLIVIVAFAVMAVQFMVPYISHRNYNLEYHVSENGPPVEVVVSTSSAQTATQGNVGTTPFWVG